MIRTIRSRIDALLAEKQTVLVAIDGICAAGKTTLAARLQEIYGCEIIHMDDFFLRPEQRTEDRYAEIGGNVDYERFREEVLLPLQAGIPLTYRPFDCKTLTLKEPVTVIPGTLVIVEGSYSLHPHFGSPYDLTILLTVPEAVQRQRILQRPAHLHQPFFDRWIPMENRYLAHHRLCKHCDLVFRQSDE